MEKRRTRKKQSIKQKGELRIVTLVMILVGMFLVISSMLTYRMIFKHEEYYALAMEQWTSEIEIDAKRGKILDRNGVELAVSANVYRVDLDLNSIRAYIKRNNNNEKKAKTSTLDIAKQLADIIDLSEKDIMAKLELKLPKSGMNASSATLIRRIEKEEADKIKALEIPGVMVAPDTNRYYPNNSFLSNVLGSTNSEGVGNSGVEARYNKELSGVPGVRITEVDRKDRETPYSDSKFTSPIDGKDVVLTIDEKIQYYAEKAAEKGLRDNNADAVTVIVTNPKNGEILAMANKPDFNPNKPYDGTSKFPGNTESEKLQNMWRNRSVENVFEPGSIFKIITGAAAIEEGIAGHNETYYCSGGLKIGSGRIACWKSEGHGTQNFNEIIGNSCNVGMMEIALKLGREKLNEYIYKFGFGSKSGVDLPGESSGIVKATEQITDLDLGAISIGQTDAVNAIQFMAAMNAAINGGTLIQPHVMKEISYTDNGGTRIIEDTFMPKTQTEIISEETSKRMNLALESAVSSGSGKPAYIEGAGIAGKSGTGEKVNFATGTYGAGYVSSFVGFAPYENPQVSIMISVDNPKAGLHFGGEVAAPLAHGLFTDLLNYMNEKPLSSSIISTQPIIPEIRGMKVEEATKILNDLGLEFNIDGNDNHVNEISPKPGQRVVEGSRITIKTGGSLGYGNEVVVPDLIGYSKDEVQSILKNVGLRATFEGDGNVIEQSVKYGEIVKNSSNIKFILGTEVN